MPAEATLTRGTDHPVARDEEWPTIGAASRSNCPSPRSKRPGQFTISSYFARRNAFQGIPDVVLKCGPVGWNFPVESLFRILKIALDLSFEWIAFPKRQGGRWRSLGGDRFRAQDDSTNVPMLYPKLYPSEGSSQKLAFGRHGRLL